MYLPFKAQVQRIVEKHFPPVITKRITYRMDSEIYIPSMDKTIWMRHKTGKESCHVMFDMVELFEVTVTLNPREAEIGILKSFKQAIQNGTICIEKRLEYSDNQTARHRKTERVREKREAIAESFQYAKEHPFSVDELVKQIDGKDKKVLQIGGENDGQTSNKSRKVRSPEK